MSTAAAASTGQIATLSAVEIAQRRTDAEKLAAAGDLPAAEAVYRAILVADLKNIYALMGLGNLARLANDHAIAETRYVEAAAIHPRSTWPLFTLINLHSAQRQWEQGEDIAARAFALNATDFHTAMAIGRLRRDRGDQSAALAAFEIAVKSDPKHTGACAEVGRTLMALDRLDEAERTFTEGLQVAAPDQCLILYRSLASVMRKKSDLPAIVIWLRQAH